MASSFISIYNNAMSKLDDPILSKIYRENSQEFFRIMYQRIKTAIADFRTPATTVSKLVDRVEPVFYTELFDGDGETSSFEVTEITLNSNCIVSALVDGSAVDVLSVVGNIVTLSSEPVLGTENVEISVYIDGYFNQTLSDQEEEILSLFVLKAWANKERNFLLDIRRLIGDKDFRLISEANSAREKNNWYNSIREEAEKKMVAFSWSSVGSRRSRG